MAQLRVDVVRSIKCDECGLEFANRRPKASMRSLRIHWMSEHPASHNGLIGVLIEGRFSPLVKAPFEHMRNQRTVTTVDYLKTRDHRFGGLGVMSSSLGHRGGFSLHPRLYFSALTAYGATTQSTTD